MTHDTQPNEPVNGVSDEHVHRRQVTLRRPLQVHRNTVRGIPDTAQSRGARPLPICEARPTHPNIGSISFSFPRNQLSYSLPRKSVTKEP